MLGLIAWNVAVYGWLMAWAMISLATHSSREPGWMQQLLVSSQRSLDGRVTGPLAGAFASFGIDWVQRSAPLGAARAARILHFSAAMLAFGAIAGLYVRGLVFEYRAGWESTFLDANVVYGLLHLFLQPAAWLIGQPFPTVDQLEALRWGDGSTGENAGPWIHLYATTVMVSVIVPRLILAVIARIRERGLSARFPLSLDEPYFRRVLSGWRELPAYVRVVPYAYTPAEAASEGLHRLTVQLFGKDAHLHSSRPVAFGDEDFMATGEVPELRTPDLVMALFNLGSTPETENHGVFLDTLRAQTKGRVAVIVDESSYRQRLGAQVGADARLAERRQVWTGFAATRGMRAIFIDLEGSDLAAAERELNATFLSNSAVA